MTFLTQFSLAAGPLEVTLAESPVRLLRRTVSQVEGQRLRETLEISLEGEGGFNDLLHSLDAILVRARAGLPAYLCAQQGGVAYRTALLDGRVIVTQQGHQSLGLRLSLERPDWWERAALEPVELSGMLFTSADGVEVNARCDSFDRSNWCLMQLPASESSLPAPLRLEIHNDLPGALPLANLHVFSALDQPYYNNVHLMEIENSQTGSQMTMQAISDAACSGGAGRSFTWNLAQPRLVSAWQLPRLLQNQCAGGPVRLALRLASPSAAGLWMHWQVADTTGLALTTSEAVRVEAGQRLVVLPALSLPASLSDANFGDRAELWAEVDALPGSLSLDCAMLLPAAFYRCYRLRSAAPASWVLVDDATGEPAVYSENLSTGQRLESHRPEGAAVLAHPGGQQKLFFVWEQADSMDLSQSIRVKVLTRRRVRTLA